MKHLRRYAIVYELTGRGRFILAASSKKLLRSQAQRLQLSIPVDDNIQLVTISYSRPRKHSTTKTNDTSRPDT